MATIKKIKKYQNSGDALKKSETLPEVVVTSQAAKKPTLKERIFGTSEKRAERKEERESRKAERQSNRATRQWEREDRRNSRCSGGGCAQRAGFGGYNKNGGVTKKAKTGMKIKKKMQAGGVAGKQPKAGMVDPKGAYTKVQERTLGNMKKGGKVKKAQNGDSTAYYNNLSKSYMEKAARAMGDNVNKTSKSYLDKSMEATRNELRQSRKGKPGFDKMGNPIKQKTGGVTSKAKDGKWIQKAINPKHKGYCTPTTKATCTPKRKALAMTLKKMAKARKGK